MHKFGTPEEIHPEPDHDQGVDAEELRREAMRHPFDPAAVAAEQSEDD